MLPSDLRGAHEVLVREYAMLKGMQVDVEREIIEVRKLIAFAKEEQRLYLNRLLRYERAPESI